MNEWSIFNVNWFITEYFDYMVLDYFFRSVHLKVLFQDSMTRSFPVPSETHPAMESTVLSQHPRAWPFSSIALWLHFVQWALDWESETQNACCLSTHTSRGSRLGCGAVCRPDGASGFLLAPLKPVTETHWVCLTADVMAKPHYVTLWLTGCRLFQGCLSTDSHCLESPVWIGFCVYFLSSSPATSPSAPLAAHLQIHRHSTFFLLLPFAHVPASYLDLFLAGWLLFILQISTFKCHFLWEAFPKQSAWRTPSAQCPLLLFLNIV